VAEKEGKGGDIFGVQKEKRFPLEKEIDLQVRERSVRARGEGEEVAGGQNFVRKEVNPRYDCKGSRCNSAEEKGGNAVNGRRSKKKFIKSLS